MARERITDVERDEARAQLRKLLPPGSIVYAVLRHVSKSGMTRRIDFYAADCPASGEEARRRGRLGPVVPISWLIVRASGGDYHVQTGKDGIVVGGCGMDMAFSVVYNLSRYLYPDGFGEACEGCGLRAGSAADAADMPFACCPTLVAHVFPYVNGTRTVWQRDGGYALRSEWL